MKQERRQNQEYREIDKTNSAEFKNTIKNQIIRSYPKNQFFHQENVQTMMQNILSAYSNYHTQFDYGRGTICLLGPLVYTLKDEAQIFWCFEALTKKIG